MEAATLADFAIIAGIGALAGLIAGFVSGADNLIGTALMGAIGGIVLSAIVRLAGGPPIYGVGGGDLSLVWGAVGGFVLGFSVGLAN